ncbi:MAG: ABC transporter substrate-binding protein [Nocardiaceae bacterium]|nr:ABC transporter substrate-binding protein [Nocardiaceae bacterium]
MLKRSAITLLAAGCVAATVAGCSADKVPSIGYAVDGPITTYNAASLEGAASAAAQAFPRTLIGFSYMGPNGLPIEDTDLGTANVVPGDALTIQYRINPKAVFSDGDPISCDDMMLTWAAHSRIFTKRSPDGQVMMPMFDVASTAGYQDIERIDCQPGAKDATVVFHQGRSYANWKMLFGATDIMPSHVAARVAGVRDIVAAIQGGDNGSIQKIADFWNTGWNLKPGKLDLSLFPASGPYRIQSYSDDDGLVLVANERWWGNKPATPRILIIPRNDKLKDKVSSGVVEVVDITAGSVDGLDVGKLEGGNVASRNVDELILQTNGAMGRPEIRRAFAQCTPRTKLFDDFGHPGFKPAETGLGAGVDNSRLVQADSLIYPAVAGTEANKYPGGDAKAALATLDGAQIKDVTIKIGYRTPDPRRAAIVKAIADACKPARINVVDAGSPDFKPWALRDLKIDAMLTGVGGTLGAGGSATGVEELYSLRTDSPTNFGLYDNTKLNDVVDSLATDPNSALAVGPLTDAEGMLWGDVPTIPLFAQPRTIAFADGLSNAIANPGRGGSGWNMDRWVLER